MDNKPASIAELALKAHADWRGKLEIAPRARADSAESLALAYTPGVAAACLAIKDDPSKAYELTRRWNTVAVVTDGSAVLGLGDIGPQAGMPVMEGKCVLFKAFADVDAFPILIGTKDADAIVETVVNIAGTFGGINLEDISSPRCFDIERRLQAALDIPVFHDDQHGTAIVVGAAMINALRVAGKSMDSARIVINGMGAAGCAIARRLLSLGAQDLLLVDRYGILARGAESELHMHGEQAALALTTNPGLQRGSLSDAMRGADAFIGVSAGNIVSKGMVASMNPGAVVFAMANPTPEIMPDDAKAAGALVVGTGRSDYPNQVNNVLCFPGMFRGALDCRAREINEPMKRAASIALAELACQSSPGSPDKLGPENILPRPFDPRVGKAVAEAVCRAARESGAARI
ncbi:MAG: NADP-dependent malic enzyme [Oscillospiraceae bacterium]|jgi:malate dehydrogenase (oxaloacetate-decarboxylating)|nr:NADP-dependent malic enzyme [Oscillospiraceae bacterium]